MDWVFGFGYLVFEEEEPFTSSFDATPNSQTPNTKHPTPNTQHPISNPTLPKIPISDFIC
ncbi:hypothetical protein Plim_4150 [Planctopirus limnophila DSM 3776]|uniref:Uncharacterized protein n=1 Tax=Planctopirus limnophila (strain ATCC 43296 / DSM 3776 / IFAM 1008 / Mu 290) TaxID=521674 RepID=D5SZ60_PLAL2|nr:hypothetical protein Plim_4150 [Planctopirus limnophila DSM 3776]